MILFYERNVGVVLLEIFLLFALLFSLFFLISYICFRIVFFVPDRNRTDSEDIQLPAGKIYEGFWDDMRKWALETRSTPFTEFSISSFDGLKLYGKFYEYAPGAPIEIMFHGYRGTAERDLSGGMQRCFRLGHSAFIVDQRCSGKSEGNVITFGICEYRDCLSWIDFLMQNFGSDVKIILTGISMGASTVLMAAGKQLPPNVIGVLADCGFHCAREIILKVAGQLHLPGKLLYPFIKFGARVYGGFDLEAYSPIEAMRSCSVPVLFFHGADDDYVPSYMSQLNFDACQSTKKIIIVPGAGHGLSYPVAPELYLDEAARFFL